MTRSIQGNTSVTGGLSQYVPEPSTTGIGMFRDVVNVAKNLTSIATQGVSGIADGEFASLIQLQLEAQREMQTTTMVSNIERSKHESKMAAIRNIRLG